MEVFDGVLYLIVAKGNDLILIWKCEKLVVQGW